MKQPGYRIQESCATCRHSEPESVAPDAGILCQHPQLIEGVCRAVDARAICDLHERVAALDPSYSDDGGMSCKTCLHSECETRTEWDYFYCAHPKVVDSADSNRERAVSECGICELYEVE